MVRTERLPKRKAHHADHGLVVGVVGARVAPVEPGPPVGALPGRVVPVEPGRLPVDIAAPEGLTGAAPAGAAALAVAVTTARTAAARLARLDVASAAALDWALRWSARSAGQNYLLT